MRMPKTPYLSVVIPAYNEAYNVEAGKLDLVHEYLTKQQYTWEVMVVDDGSTDDTVPLIKKWLKGKKGWTLITNSHFGKSKTVETGMLRATGEIRLFTDFDQATPIEEVEKVFKKM